MTSQPELTTSGDQPRSPEAIPGRSQLRISDALVLGTLGLRGRPLRAALSSLGIALGIAAVVGVLGLSASSSAGVLREIDRLGTDMLRVSAGQTLTGDPSALPEHAAGSLSRVSGVRDVGWTAPLKPSVYRSTLIPPSDTAGLTLRASSDNLLRATSTSLTRGRWFDAATARLPVAVLGAKAAGRLGISVPGGELLSINGQQVRVIGILAPSALEPGLDTSVLVGSEAARASFGWDGSPGTLYVRSSDEAVARLGTVLPFAANPQAAQEVQVSRPSDALVAKAITRNAFTGLFLGLGAVALLVGGVGVANVMVINVLERRGEIGLRRALGARRPHVAAQFVLEALTLSVLGGVSGVAIGAAVTVVYARSHDWTIVIPVSALIAASVASVLVGAIAGLYPAVRAARISPTQALAAL
ncbi:MAG: ABC transporter permease [Angustibacter sp.]